MRSSTITGARPTRVRDHEELRRGMSPRLIAHSGPLRGEGARQLFPPLLHPLHDRVDQSRSSLISSCPFAYTRPS
jgi:hypothetical protein